MVDRILGIFVCLVLISLPFILHRDYKNHQAEEARLVRIELQIHDLGVRLDEE